MFQRIWGIFFFFLSFFFRQGLLCRTLRCKMYYFSSFKIFLIPLSVVCNDFIHLSCDSIRQISTDCQVYTRPCSKSWDGGFTQCLYVLCLKGVVSGEASSIGFNAICEKRNQLNTEFTISAIGRLRCSVCIDWHHQILSCWGSTRIFPQKGFPTVV
jgi:hypothetical protein